jgi:hypothetical protein
MQLFSVFAYQKVCSHIPRSLFALLWLKAHEPGSGSNWLESGFSVWEFTGSNLGRWLKGKQSSSLLGSGCSYASTLGKQFMGSLGAVAE